MTTNPSPLVPAPVGDRRAPERRSRTQAEDERRQLIMTAASTTVAVCGGLAFLFFAFAALGAIDIGNATLATVVAFVLAGVWVAGFIYRRRHADTVAVRHDRERRGF